mmetsp:Transcript_14267/g.31633  ORF Transcript_14267/g.31633 Transcript_14267/m.31633 type:complete len:409 (+) Transcript_14267:1213-2439(+)
MAAEAAKSRSSSSKVDAPALQPGVPWMTSCSARPKEKPAYRALLNNSKVLSLWANSRASLLDFMSRPSSRSRLDNHCGALSLQRLENRSSRHVAASGPHRMDAGKESSPPEDTLEAAAPTNSVRTSCGSNLLQSSKGGPCSKQTNKLQAEPMCFIRISSIFKGGSASMEHFSGRSTTSRLAQPAAESRRRRDSNFRRCPKACCVAFCTPRSQLSASGACGWPRSALLHLSSKAMGCRMPGWTRTAEAACATAVSPSSPDMSSRRAAMPPSRTHAGKRPNKSRTPSTSQIFSNWLRTSLNAQAMPSMVRRRRFAFGSGARAMARAGEGANMADASGGLSLAGGFLFSARRPGWAGSFFTFFCGCAASPPLPDTVDTGARPDPSSGRSCAATATPVPRFFMAIGRSIDPS